MRLSKIFLIFFITLLFLNSPKFINAINLKNESTPQNQFWMKNLPPFQATLKNTTILKNGTKETWSAKYFFNGNKIRTEDTKYGTISIIDLDKKIGYSFIKQNNIWIKMDFGEAEQESKKIEKITEIKKENLPDAVVDGKICEVTKYTYQNPNTKKTYQSIVYVWKEKNIPLKVVANFEEGQVEVIYTDIVLTKTPENMFSPPPGAKIMDMSTMLKEQNE